MPNMNAGERLIVAQVFECTREASRTPQEARLSEPGQMAVAIGSLAVLASVCGLWWWLA